ncbi:MAG: DUF2723 domain-containing protein, partial [Deltaproteobacteria bacterium]|nr:DUF2723 domain-containing protein [Deltaproteobacteria bacterium]
MRTAQLTFGLVLVALVLDATGGPGWGIASARAVLAARMDHSAGAPLYDVLASVAALLPFGEVGFRVALLGALLGALTAVGVLEAARVLVPKDPFAAIAGIVVLVLAPPFRESSPALLAACGTVWALARAGTLAGLASCAIVVGSAPVLGLVLAVPIGRKTPREDRPLGLAILGMTAIALWLGAEGRLPGIHPSLARAIAETQGGAIVVGAGLIGIGFGALTGLPRARELTVIAVIVAAYELVVGGAGTTLLATLAIGIAVLPAAIVRAAGPSTDARRTLVAIVAAVPLAGAALLVGITRERPGSTPTRLVDDLTADVPAGPGVLVATRAPSYEALQYEMSIAGARPDLALVPPLPPQQADVVVAEAIRADKIAAADAAAFGRLDVKRVIPRGRGFQLIGDLPDHGEPVLEPATYPTALGAQESAMLALERARHEAASGRLDAAARAAGLTDRFHAADLAVLAATIPSKQRPALFGFLPLDQPPPGRWLLDVFGDDLAWVAGLELPKLSASDAMPRRLHALWT